MVLSNLGDNSTGLSMKFREISDDMVFFDATVDDKNALLAFLDASLDDIDLNRVEMGNVGANQPTLEAIREAISTQLDSNGPVTMSRSQFGYMGMAAKAWKTHGFDLAQPEEYDGLGVSKNTVETVIAMHAECFDI